MQNTPSSCLRIARPVPDFADALPVGDGAFLARIAGHAQEERIALCPVEDAYTKPPLVLWLWTGHGGICQNYGHCLDFDSAISSVSYSLGHAQVRREAFFSRADHVLAVRMEADAPEGVQICIRFDLNCAPAKICPREGDFEVRGAQSALLGLLRLRVSGNEPVLSQNALSAQGVREVTLLFKPCLGKEPLRLPPAPWKYETLLRRHVKQHAPLMEGRRLELHTLGQETREMDTMQMLLRVDEPRVRDGLLMKLYAFGRYLHALGMPASENSPLHLKWRQAALPGNQDSEFMEELMGAGREAADPVGHVLGKSCPDIAAMALACAALGRGRHALGCLELLLRSCVGAGLYTRPGDVYAQGNARYTPRQGHESIGNDGVVAVVSAMLAQKHRGGISVLPALPDRWARGGVQGLEVDGVRISIGWDIHRRWLDVELCARRARQLKLYLPFSCAKGMDALGQTDSCAPDGALLLFLPEGRPVRRVLRAPRGLLRGGR